MKRLFLCAGLVLSLTILNSCAQHDPNSPDTSGNLPKDKPGAGIDTSQVSTQNNGSNPNGSNDGTNNNQQVTTGDTGTKKQ